MRSFKLKPARPAQAVWGSRAASGGCLGQRLHSLVACLPRFMKGCLTRWQLRRRLRRVRRRIAEDAAFERDPLDVLLSSSVLLWQFENLEREAEPEAEPGPGRRRRSGGASSSRGFPLP